MDWAIGNVASGTAKWTPFKILIFVHLVKLYKGIMLSFNNKNKIAKLCSSAV